MNKRLKRELQTGCISLSSSPGRQNSSGNDRPEARMPRCWPGSLLQARHPLPGTAGLRKNFKWQRQQVIRQCAGERASAW
jgi:hypothetical protein